MWWTVDVQRIFLGLASNACRSRQRKTDKAQDFNRRIIRIDDAFPEAPDNRHKGVSLRRFDMTGRKMGFDLRQQRRLNLGRIYKSGRLAAHRTAMHGPLQHHCADRIELLHA